MDKSEQTRERIFQTAFRLFEERGIRNTTIPTICEEANVSRSTFFHYFKSKNALLADFRFGFADRLEEVSRHLPEGLSGKEKVRFLLLYDAQQNIDAGGMLRQAIICSLDKNPEFRDSDERTYEKLPPIYGSVLKESYPTASAEYCAKVGLLITRLFWAIWRQCVILQDRYDFKKELSDSLDLIWDGFGFEEN